MAEFEGQAADRRRAGRLRDQGARLWALLEKWEGLLVVGILLLGAVYRFVWLLSQRSGLSPVIGEMQNVATTFARTGVLGDPYGPGSGPTTHVGPVMPILQGTVYRLAGIETPLAEGILVWIAIGFVIGGIYFFWRSFKELGLPAPFRVAAVAFAALPPLNFNLELRALRSFEGAFAVALVALSLWTILRLDRRSSLTWRDFLGPTFVAALLFLLNPPAGMAVLAALGLLTLKRVPVRRWVSVGLCTGVALVAVLGPWAWRNVVVFDKPIFTRGNFGLEFSIGFHPAALSDANPKQVYLARMEEVHPFMDPRPRAEVVRLGEIAYFAKLQAETDAWISANPQGAATLALRHLRDFWFPPQWVWGTFLGPGAALPSALPIRQGIIWVSSLLALLALGLRLARDPLGRYLYVGCLLILPSLPYILVQPMLRYRYLIETLCVFLAAELVWRLWRSVSSKAPPEARGTEALGDAREN